MSLNLYNLEMQLAQKMQSAATEEDLLFYAKTLELIRNNAITVVSTFSELPPVTAAIAGELYFVQSDQLLYIPVVSLGIWRTLVASYVTSLWSWGDNIGGALGDNTAVSRSSPVSVVGGITNWCRVSAGYSHVAVLTSSGTIWSWGQNNNGSIGDNSVVCRSSPVSVVGGFTDWCQISAGTHTLAIRPNGTLWAWGFNALGQLGDNTTVNKSSPVSVVGGFTDWCQVSTKITHTVALRTNGTIWAWGRNISGELGDTTTVSKLSPVSIVGGFTDWCQISAGRYQTSALRTNGTLWAWGSNDSGQLGDNTTVNKSSPISVVGGFTDWYQVSAACHTVGLKINGTLWAWGQNNCGQLGDNTAVNKSSPVSVVGGFTDWCQVSAGAGLTNHTAALRTNGTLWTWGSSQCGKLGDNTIIAKSSPVSVVGGFTDWCQVSAGGSHTEAIRTKTF